MTIRHLKIFLAVCDGGCNTTRAAEALTMAQPAVSLALKELEQYYGVVLFDRVGRHLQITAAGKRLWEYASHITSLFDDMEKGMRDWDTFGILRVGASITIGSQFLPNYVKAFYARHPGTEIRAVIEPSDRLEAQILSSDLDLALMEGMSHSPSLESEEYMEDHLVVICPARGRFVQGQTLTQEEFRSQKFLLREPGSGTRETFQRVMEEAGLSVEPIWEAMSTTALVNAVINGLGITVLPHRMVLGPLSKGLVVSVRVEGLEFRRKYYIVRHRAKYLTASARAFLDLCRSYEMDYPMPRYSGLF
ncbi:MAG TPA: LysR family transcriptional regulator [Candidatus Faecalibacterium intestinigallinarum]|uniref:LysR family transcriptional regulator n=1 Tax=Candidatus Faecalibacterium intestinigallinarum TaxID=2838581 RepID=A0A9D1TX33_9FIRM|nr:LysR family transcriptional regulator [Candidatus Faecalibacterium intestinigallinarum]